MYTVRKKESVGKMKIAIVENEELYSREMSQICTEFGALHGRSISIKSYTSGEDFLADFETARFDLVFMDIYMDGMSGVETAVKLRERDKRLLLVFLTSSTDFMPEAFTCHAFEYITKPIDKLRALKVLSDAMQLILPNPKYIELKSGRRSVMVPLSDILAVVSSGHYLDFHLSSGETHRCRMTAPEFLERCERDRRFLRANRGVILNIDYIDELENSVCVMKNGMYFPIKVRDYASIEQVIYEYNFAKIRSRQGGGSV